MSEFWMIYVLIMLLSRANLVAVGFELSTNIGLATVMQLITQLG